jgi:purine-binding chemotaxis protein CheW
MKRTSPTLKSPMPERRKYVRTKETQQQSLDQSLKKTAAEKKITLKARAKELAKEPLPENVMQKYLKVVEYSLGKEKYGIEASCIREVCALGDLTPLPSTPPFILGIINVRGQILAVVDMKKIFNLPAQKLTDLTKILIIDIHPATFGVLVDEVLGMRFIAPSELQPTRTLATEVHTDYVKEVTSDRLIILDLVKMVADKKITVNEECKSL